jgi:long-subunit fatty acid transport protein
MNAQVYLGGAFGLGFENKLIDKDGKDATGVSFAIKPEIGYNLNEKSSVGIVLGFGLTNNTNQMLNRNDSFGELVLGNRKTDKTAIQFEVAPYFRYKFVQFEKVDLFIDAMVGFTYTKLDEWNNTTFAVGVRPGIAYTPTDKISLVAKLGNGLFFQSSKDKDADARSKFGLEGNTLGALEFGMYYNF